MMRWVLIAWALMGVIIVAHLAKSNSSGHLLKDGTGDGHLLRCIEECPTDCSACDSSYTVVISGLTGSCSGINGSYTVTQSGSTCSWSYYNATTEDTVIVGCIIVNGMRAWYVEFVGGAGPGGAGAVEFYGVDTDWTTCPDSVSCTITEQLGAGICDGMTGSATCG